MAGGGFLLLHRKIVDSEVFANEGLLKVFLWCLCKGSHRQRFVDVSTGRGNTTVELKRGEFLFGRKTAAAALNMKESTLRDRMDRLQEMGCIEITPDRHYSVVSIVNWDVYQPGPADRRQATDSQPTGKHHATDTNKNAKNAEKGKTSFGVGVSLSFSEEEKSAALRWLARITEAVPPLKANDWEEAAKVTLLFLDKRFSEDDLVQAIKGAEKHEPKAKRPLYFRGILQNKAAKYGEKLNAMLASIEELPAWLPRPAAGG